MRAGTSQKSRDALFVGYSSHLVTGVWLGNDDDSPTTLTGGSFPAKIWSDFMTKAHAGIKPSPLPGSYTPSPEDLQAEADLQQQAAQGTTQPQIDPSQPAHKGRSIGDIIGSLFNGGNGNN